VPAAGGSDIGFNAAGGADFAFNVRDAGGGYDLYALLAGWDPFDLLWGGDGGGAAGAAGSADRRFCGPRLFLIATVPYSIAVSKLRRPFLSDCPNPAGNDGQRSPDRGPSSCPMPQRQPRIVNRDGGAPLQGLRL
jgi:hypothetical protein